MFQIHSISHHTHSEPQIKSNLVDLLRQCKEALKGEFKRYLETFFHGEADLDTLILQATECLTQTEIEDIYSSHHPELEWVGMGTDFDPDDPNYPRYCLEQYLSDQLKRYLERAEEWCLPDVNFPPSEWSLNELEERMSLPF